VSSTNRVVSLVKVLREIGKALALDVGDALLVELFDRFVDHWLIRELVSKPEALAPVTEVARDDENRLVIHEIGQEHLCIIVILVFWDISNHKGHEFDLLILASIFEDFLDEREMHLETVLVLFELRHYLYDLGLAFFMTGTDSIYSLLVDYDVSKRGLPLITCRSAHKVKVYLVRWTE